MPYADQPHLAGVYLFCAGVHTKWLDLRKLRAIDLLGSPQAGAIRALLPPIDLGVEPRMDSVPALGQHTDPILAELDRDPRTYDELVAVQTDSRSEMSSTA